MKRFDFTAHKARHGVLLNVGVTALTLILLLILAEIVFRISGRYATFNEKFGQPYASLFEGQKSWYHIYPPHEVTSQDLKEYSYSLKANNEGFLDKEFTVQKTANGFRIMVIGDSFVQGMGAVADSTCPKLLEDILRAERGAGADIEVWNCGIGGSDPFFEYVLLRDRLLKYQPDYVIVALNSTDVTDVMLRGGFERFKADSSVAFRPAPWFEPLYAKSYLVRTVVHDILNYNWMFLRPRQEAKVKANSMALLDSVLYDFKDLCSRRNVPLLIAFTPMVHELDGSWKEYDIQGLIRYCDSAHIPNADVKQYMEQAGFAGDKAKTLYWPIDMHFNRKGYEEFAKCLSTRVEHYLDSISPIPIAVQAE